MIFSAISVSTLLMIVLLPVIVMNVMALLLLPSLFQPNAKAGAVMKALYCYFLQAIGVAMMSIGGLPAVYGVLQKFATGQEQFGAEVYLALLILFCVGGITFLWHEQVSEKIDDASRRIPALLYWYAFKVLGYLLALYGGLSVLLTMLLIRPPLPETWWVTPFVLFLYGMLLTWCTRMPASPASSFSSMPMMNGMKKMATAVKGKRK